MVRQVVSVDAETLTRLTTPNDPLLRGPESARDCGSDQVAELFRDHRYRLVNLAFAITLDAGVADEIVQDAFLGLQRRVGDVDNPVGYLQRSVVNRSVSIIRRRRLANLRAAQAPPPSSASSPEIDEMWSRVQHLPPKQRAVVVLRFWEDLSLAEIARVLRRPSGSVKSTLHRALMTLKEDLP